MAEDMVARLANGELTVAQLRIVQSIRLAQITSGIVRTESGSLIRLGNEKLRVLEERLTDLFEADQKIILCGRWRADIAAMVNLAKKFKVKYRYLIGGMKTQDRDRSWRSFQQLDGPAVMVMNPQVGGLGIDLSSAATMIWYSLTRSYVDFTQAEDRIALSRRSTTYEYLLCPGIDRVMYKTLLTDGDIVKEIMKSPDHLLRNFKG
jgi:SNF2 family DNA or RNA helicase